MKCIMNPRPDIQEELIKPYKELEDVYSLSCVVGDAMEREQVMRHDMKPKSINKKIIGPAITVKSNLNSAVFVEIMETIGLNYSQYEGNFKLLDEVLLKMRNEIAHGEKPEYIDLDQKRFNEVYEKILEMMNTFSAQVMNAACLKEYKQN